MQADQYLEQTAGIMNDTVSGSDFLQQERKPAGLTRIANEQDVSRCYIRLRIPAE